MKENVIASARSYFDGYPGKTKVLVTDDGHCFHAEDGGAAKLHTEKAGVGLNTVTLKDLEPKAEEKPAKEPKPAKEEKADGKGPDGETQS